MTPVVYLDHNATTPVRPEVLEAMLPWLRDLYGNPSSVHSFGQRARRAVEEARAAVARLLNASKPEELVFTSGGSEALALAVLGAAEGARLASGGAKRRVVTTRVEHEAHRGLGALLEGRGFEVVAVEVDGEGRVEPAEVLAALRPDTALVSVMLANNEVGTLQPVAELARLCRERGIPSHTDAVQAVGKVPVDVQALGVDLLSLSGHKFNAPKGVGALYARQGTALVPVVAGHQERNRRGGTENVAGIVGLGAAARLAGEGLAPHARELEALRDRLEEGLARVPGSRRMSRAAARLSNTCHFCFEGLDGHDLVIALDLEGVCASSGSACAGGLARVSHVLEAMGVPSPLARGALRLSLGWGSTAADVARVLEVLPGAVERLRSSRA
ncbi:MAG: aminotransferase class V-fold PLP-dependent enzyme [Elusimicrobiota bacterium]|jgi:cysteine desulfurase